MIEKTSKRGPLDEPEAKDYPSRFLQQPVSSLMASESNVSRGQRRSNPKIAMIERQVK